MKRWKATCYYRTDVGLIDVEHELEEIEELGELVERGPHWGALDRIEIRLARSIGMEGLTIEQTLAL